MLFRSRRAPRAGGAHGGRGPAARSDRRAREPAVRAGASPRATGKHCGGPAGPRALAAPAGPGILGRAARRPGPRDAPGGRRAGPDPPQVVPGCGVARRPSGARATGDGGAGGRSSPPGSPAGAVPGLVLGSGTSDTEGTGAGAGSVVTVLAACAVLKVHEHLFSAHCVPTLLLLPAPRPPPPGCAIRAVAQALRLF